MLSLNQAGSHVDLREVLLVLALQPPVDRTAEAAQASRHAVPDRNAEGEGILARGARCHVVARSRQRA
eukprot:11842049-Alexandrium_andersonii.AAC.1